MAHASRQPLHWISRRNESASPVCLYGGEPPWLPRPLPNRALHGDGTAIILTSMSIEEIKSGIACLTPIQQSEVTSFLFHLRHASDVEYQERVNSRLSDTEREHWLTPEEFERKLDQR